MKAAPTIQNPATPSALDNVLIAINTGLLSEFTWLNNAFGKAQILTRKDDRGRIKKYPAIYTGVGREYASLFPNEGYGNFCWWHLSDYEIPKWIAGQPQIIEVDFGLVFWFNVLNVLAADERRNIEMLKEDALSFFIRFRVADTRITPGLITEDNDKIYRGLDIKEVDKKYLMHPFGGFRINGRLKYQRLC